MVRTCDSEVLQLWMPHHYSQVSTHKHTVSPPPPYLQLSAHASLGDFSRYHQRILRSGAVCLAS